MQQDNLTNKQLDANGASKYAVYLPAISTFYSTYIGKQQSQDPKYMIPEARIPSRFNTGIEGMNWYNSTDAYFPYKWSLYSAGHADLDLTNNNVKENMTRCRDKNSTFLLGDSGGFQIAKGVWEGNWADPTDKVTSKKRDSVLKWLDGTCTYAMGLDIPAWVVRDPIASNKINIRSYSDALAATQYNNEYFIKHRIGWRNGGTKFLNVLQGENHTDADHWYSVMKKYCDPKQYPNNHFDGWAMGGQNMADVHLVLNRLIALRHDGLLEPGLHDWMHFLGTSKLEWAVLLTDLQTAVRKYHNPQFTISFDCASPFLATANGQIYYQISLPNRGRWSYKMKASVDNKKYATDHRLMRDAFLNDGHFKHFEDSPISSRCEIKDICVYGPGDLNKLGKEGKTSWDSFSYALQMGHNVWTHIEAVQRANQEYAINDIPSMLIEETFNRTLFRDLANEIFMTGDRGKAEQLVKSHSKFWTNIGGTRGFTGKKTINAHTQYNNLFEVIDTQASKPVLLSDLDETEALTELDHLEENITNAENL